MSFQSLKLSVIDGFPDMENIFSCQDVETVVLPNLNDAPSNIGHAIGRAFQRNRYSKPRSSGRPEATRCLSKDEVFYLRDAYEIAAQKGFPLNGFVTINLGSDDKDQLRQAINYMKRRAGKFGPVYAFWVYEKPLNGSLHAHVLIHASQALLNDLQRQAKRRRHLDPETKKKQVMRIDAVRDDKIVPYMTKQHEAVEGKKRLLQPEKKLQYCLRIAGERWGMSAELKALLPDKKKPRDCRQGPLKQRAEKPTLPVGSKLAA